MTQAIALGVGVNGALVDVTSYVTGPEGVQYDYGRQSEFRDPTPGQFTFVLDNYDGRFTPGNAASPLATLLIEGTQVCWQIGSRLVGGQVSAIGFASAETDWGRVTITASDVFYIANRTQLTGLSNDASANGAYDYWSFADAVSSAVALESSGNNGPAFGLTNSSTVIPIFGAAAVPNVTGTQAEFIVAAATQAQYIATPHTGLLSTSGPALGAKTFPAGSIGAWGMWVTAQNLTSWFELQTDGLFGWKLGLQGSNFVLWAVSSSSYVVLPAQIVPGVASYLSAQLTISGGTRTITVYVNGVQVGTDSSSGIFGSTQYPTLVFGNASAGLTDVIISQLSFKPWRVKAESARTTDIADLIGLIAQTVPQMTIGTIDPAVSSAPVAANSVSNAWTTLCDAVRTEQGHIYTATSGALLAPTTVVNVRARTRPASVSLTLDAAADLDGVPPFDHDITNMFGVISATGPNSGSVTVTDPVAVARVGSAYTSESTDLVNPTDLLGYAYDRMVRGENVALKVQHVVVNTTTSTVTLAQVLALNLGDRISITNLPTGPLGFTQWDGWFLGASEVHSPLGGDVFTLYVAPVLPQPGIFDTDRFAAGGPLTLNGAITVGGPLTLNGAITSSATTMPVISTDALTFLSTTDTFTVIIDSEQITITACTAVSFLTQTATITRGVNSTTAAAHASGALLEVIPAPVYAF